MVIIFVLFLCHMLMLLCLRQQIVGGVVCGELYSEVGHLLCPWFRSGQVTWPSFQIYLFTVTVQSVCTSCTLSMSVFCTCIVTYIVYCTGACGSLYRGRLVAFAPPPWIKFPYFSHLHLIPFYASANVVARGIMFLECFVRPSERPCMSPEQTLLAKYLAHLSNFHHYQSLGHGWMHQILWSTGQSLRSQSTFWTCSCSTLVEA